VDSSVVASVGYETASKTLEIEFATGRVYRYFLVPRRVHEELMGAPSLGRYFNEHVRDSYPTREL
jgi:hypothetical protein